MSRTSWLASLTLLAAACAEPISAQPPGNAKRGEAYAARACAECHETAAGVPTPAFAQAPSFTAIAATPGMTSMALNAWFVTSHPNMPNFILAERDREDLLAWFAALREAHKQADAPH